MKVYMKEIEVLAVFDTGEFPRPLRIRIHPKDDDTPQLVEKVTVIPVGKVNAYIPEKIAGIKSIRYQCESGIDNTRRQYELKYEIDNCKWYMYKC